ncbi:MAG: peroxidase, partial [Myxococcales bacterium]|nr:peroxidase [Myxococcales bacterium]
PGEERSDKDRFAYRESGERNDVNGERCPIGAHIRRTNPRDWNLSEDRNRSMELANLHRIIRRGRPYGKPFTANLTQEEILAEIESPTQDTERRGLAFLCFNGNIERQFEFIQQQWANNSQFAGLNADSDAVMGAQSPPGVGRGDAPPTFTIQDAPLRIRLEGMLRFVKVVGSGYFFMPSLRAVKHLGELQD